MQNRVRHTVAGLTVLLATGLGTLPGMACNTRPQVTVYFKAVQTGYLQRADALTAAEYAAWGAYLEEFAQAVRRNDLRSACAALADAARDLELDVRRGAASAAGG